MSKRVSPAERLRVQIDEVFAGGQDLSRAIEEVARLGAQLLLQCAVEAEVAAFLGRDRYERAMSCQDPRVGMRNGYCPTTIKTTAGPITVQRPKLRNTTERFASQLFGTGVTKTNALEALVIAGFVRGLSTRDVEAALTEALGESATVSRSTVSRICTEIKTQFQAWSARRLDDVSLDYLFLDGSHFKYHTNAAAEPVLAAWGIDTDGKPMFIGLEAASSESGDAWEGFLAGLGERGLACPLLVVSDGAAGLIGAAERTMGAALRQRCLIHRARITSWPRCPPTPRPTSRPTTGPSSICPRASHPAWTRWPSPRAALTRSLNAGATPTPRQCAVCSPTATRSRSTCASPASTGNASGIPTSSNAPSVRAAAESK